jgi:hypothetical protein
MSSVLDEILDLTQFQHESTTFNASLSPSPLMPRRICDDSTENCNNGSPPSSDDEDEQRGTQASPGTQDSLDNVAAFAINVARDLRLTTEGERSLLQFSQVTLFFLLFMHRFHIFQTMHQAGYKICFDLPAGNAHQVE